MHANHDYLGTAHDVATWLALGGLAMWGAPLGRRLCHSVPPGVWPLAMLGLWGWAARLLSWAVGPVPDPACLEQFAGHNGVGHALLLLGLGGWAWALVQRSMSTQARAKRPRRMLVAALPILAGAPWAMMPPWAPDESLYHLSLSLHSLLAGHIWAPEGHGNGGFFALGDHIAQLGLWMGSMPAARGAQMWLVVFAAEAAWALMPALTLPQVALAQGLFVLSPVVLWQLGCAYVDIMQGAFELVALMLWAQSISDARRPFAPVALCGWLLGCAVGCKVLALVWLPLFGAWATHQGLRGTITAQSRWPKGWPILLAVVMCLPFLPDVAHNLGRYHTPLFPWGAPWWPGGETLVPSQHQALQHFLALHGPTLDGVPVQGWQRYAALPYALMFEAQFASPQFDGVVGVLPVCWLLVTLAALRLPTTAPLRALGRVLQGAVAVRLVLWLCTSLQARFLIGALWSMAWLTVLLGAQVLRHRNVFARPIARAAVFGALGLGVVGWAGTLRGHLPPLALSAWGKDAAARHRDRLRAVPASALCDLVPPGEASVVMLVWSQRLSLFCLGEQLSDSYDEGASLKQAIDRAAGDGAGIAALLRARGATHMLIHEARTHDDFTAAQWRGYTALRARALHIVAAVGSEVLYKIVPI